MESKKRLGFSHNDIHDGQIVLFKRNPRVPIVLGKDYQILNCRFMPKFIDFGASTLNGDFSDDVAQVVAVFHRLFPLFNLMDTPEFEEAAGSDPKDAQVVKRFMNVAYFNEFRLKKSRKTKIRLCIGCLAEASHVIEDTTFHVCGERCAQHYIKTKTNL